MICSSRQIYKRDLLLWQVIMYCALTKDTGGREAGEENAKP